MNMNSAFRSNQIIALLCLSKFHFFKMPLALMSIIQMKSALRILFKKSILDAWVKPQAWLNFVCYYPVSCIIGAGEATL